jgi:hypothetical protein
MYIYTYIYIYVYICVCVCVCVKGAYCYRLEVANYKTECHLGMFGRILRAYLGHVGPMNRFYTWVMWSHSIYIYTPALPAVHMLSGTQLIWNNRGRATGLIGLIAWIPKGPTKPRAPEGADGQQT